MKKHVEDNINMIVFILMSILIWVLIILNFLGKSKGIIITVTVIYTLLNIRASYVEKKFLPKMFLSLELFGVMPSIIWQIF